MAPLRASKASGFLFVCVPLISLSVGALLFVGGQHHGGTPETRRYSWYWSIGRIETKQ
jgi:hypothetical protein